MVIRVMENPLVFVIQVLLLIILVLLLTIQEADHHSIIKEATRPTCRGISINRVAIVVSLALNTGARIVKNLLPDPDMLINPLVRVFQ